ncbi:MAG TPA: hypothetical protein DEA08_23295 [Planctomycetes bacterium]|nr:hypothetical protein [Planctomycetota bacterium]
MSEASAPQPPPLTAETAGRALCQSLVAPVAAAITQFPLWGTSARPLALLACSLLLGPLAWVVARALALRNQSLRFGALAALTFALCLLIFAMEVNSRLTLLLWAGDSLEAALPKVQSQTLTLLNVAGHQTKASFLDVYFLEAAAVVLCLGCSVYARQGPWRDWIQAPLAILCGGALAGTLASLASHALWTGALPASTQLLLTPLLELVLSAIVLALATPFAFGVWVTLVGGERLARRIGRPRS